MKRKKRNRKERTQIERNRKERTWIKRTRVWAALGIALVLAAAGGIGGYVYWNVHRKPVTLLFEVPWSEGTGIARILDEIDRFREVHPRIRVELRSRSMPDLNRSWSEGWGEELPSLAVGSIRPEGGGDFFFREPHLWTGPVWALYYNRNVLAAVWPGGAPEDFRTGRAGLDEYEAVFSDLAGRGIVPVSVGYQYTWPLGAWIQHMAHSGGGTDAGAPPVRGGDAPGRHWQAALDRWSRWERNGWVSADARREDWARSVIRVARGEAAFVLIAASLATTIPFENRRDVGVLPFPRGDHDSWTVGSLWYLGIPGKAENRRETELLFNHLTGPGAVGRLERGFGQRFFAAGGAGPGVLIPSLTSDTQSGFMRFVSDFRGSWE